ncbi:MAG: antitoxin [Longimicrobiales bacterium]
MAEHGESREGATGRRARLFWNGRSQAVRLPLEFRFEGEEVEIRREGDAVILEPVRRRTWPRGYWDHIDELKEGLDFDDVEPLGGALLDIGRDEE